MKWKQKKKFREYVWDMYNYNQWPDKIVILSNGRWEIRNEEDPCYGIFHIVPATIYYEARGFYIRDSITKRKAMEREIDEIEKRWNKYYKRQDNKKIK